MTPVNDAAPERHLNSMYEMLAGPQIGAVLGRSHKDPPPLRDAQSLVVVPEEESSTGPSVIDIDDGEYNDQDGEAAHTDPKNG